MSRTIKNQEDTIIGFINSGISCYLFKEETNNLREGFILLEIDREKTIKLDGNYVNEIQISFSYKNSAYKLYYEKNSTSTVLLWKNDKELIINIIESIDITKCLLLLNKYDFVENFINNHNKIFNLNTSWEEIEYAGLFIRHKFYNSRYSDFGYKNYYLSISCNTRYLSPYSKEPIEFDFFHHERTNVWFKHPSNFFDHILVDNFMDEELVRLIFQICFDHFFDRKKWVSLNYDDVFEIFNGFLPTKLKWFICRLSFKNFKFQRNHDCREPDHDEW